MSCPKDPQWSPDSSQACLWERRICADQVQPWLLPPWWLCRGDSDLWRTQFLGCFTTLCLWVKLLKLGADWQVLNIWRSKTFFNLFFFSSLPFLSRWIRRFWFHTSHKSWESDSWRKTFLLRGGCNYHRMLPRVHLAWGGSDWVHWKQPVGSCSANLPAQWVWAAKTGLKIQPLDIQEKWFSAASFFLMWKMEFEKIR